MAGEAGDIEESGRLGIIVGTFAHGERCCPPRTSDGDRIHVALHSNRAAVPAVAPRVVVGEGVLTVGQADFVRVVHVVRVVVAANQVAAVDLPCVLGRICRRVNAHRDRRAVRRRLGCRRACGLERIADVCICRVLRARVIVRRVVDAAAVEQAAGGPLRACCRGVRRADGRSSIDALRLGLDHPLPRQAVLERERRPSGCAHERVRRVLCGSLFVRRVVDAARMVQAP